MFCSCMLKITSLTPMHKFRNELSCFLKMEAFLALLPACASELGNVIGSVCIYICVCTKNIVIE